jgi:NADH-quinone oxidoreductase subunit J
VDRDRAFNWSGVIIALAVFGGLLWAILSTPTLGVALPALEPLTVRQIGEALMIDYVWPLQCIGLVLTAALLGALVLVMEEKR